MIDRGMKKELLVLLLILAAALVVRLVFIHEPFERDEGTYAYIGQEILRGALPYRDVVDLKPPGIYYLYSLMIATFGNSVEGIRLFTACYAAATTFAVYLLARSLYGTLAALLASVLFGLFSSGPAIHGSSSNSEVFLLLPLVLGAYFVFRAAETGRRSLAAWGGFCVGMAVLIKTVALPFALFYAVYLFLTAKGAGWRERIALLACLVAPAVAVGVAVLAYFSANGALHDLVYWNTAFSKLFGTPPDLGVRLLLGLRASSEALFLWVVALPTACWLLARSRENRGIFVASLIPISFLAVALPRWFAPHYFIVMVPALAIASGVGLAELWQQRGKTFYLAIPVIALSLLYTIRMDYPYYFVYTADEVSLHKYGANENFPASVAIAEYLRERTAPDEYIYQWGWEPEIYFLASRRAPNKYIYSIAPAAAEDPARAVEELRETLLAKKPKYIVMQADGPTTKHSRAPGFAEISEILATHYTFDTVMGYGVIFRLKS
jgi:4-amino-4-deoxy-L-arabinose transferase-like glycosyltransferase